MPIENDRFLSLLGAFADLEQRRDAARDLARCVGGEDLMIFVPDPELEVMLPAPGLPQTLPDAGQWRAFVDRCRKECFCRGELPDLERRQVPAQGICAEESIVAVVLGGSPREDDLARIRPVLTLLSALFRSEARASIAETRVSAAGEAVARAGELTRTLQAMRARLETALLEVESARIEAQSHAEQTEALADELQTQAVYLENQAAELEMLNAELEERTEDAERARLAADTANRAKSEFLATMSHELRTPINAIIGYTDLLEMGIAGAVTPEQRDQLSRIRASSRHLLTLVNDVLDLAKIEAARMKVEHLRESVGGVVAETLGMLALHASDHGIRVEDACEDPELTYVGDKNRVRQILTNLLSNAIKFTEPGGSVTMRCGQWNEPPVDARVSGKGPWTYIQVEDTGIGISSEEIGKVFRPFVQAETGHSRVRGGTGLGLTISRHLARLMGGDLTVSSEPGRGSSFTLWLPTQMAVSGTLDESIRVGTEPEKATDGIPRMRGG